MNRSCPYVPCCLLPRGLIVEANWLTAGSAPFHVCFAVLWIVRGLHNGGMLLLTDLVFCPVALHFPPCSRWPAAGCFIRHLCRSAQADTEGGLVHWSARCAPGSEQLLRLPKSALETVLQRICIACIEYCAVEEQGVQAKQAEFCCC